MKRAPPAADPFPGLGRARHAGDPSGAPTLAAARPSPHRLAGLALGIGLALWTAAARAEPETLVPACYPTGGGAREICRSPAEPEGVFAAPPACRYASDVQILRLKGRAAPGPLQVVHHAEPHRTSRKGEETCEDGLRATDASQGASVRTGHQSEQLATTMPPTDPRFWAGEVRADRPRPERRRSRRARKDARDDIRAVAAAAKEGTTGRNPMTVAGRDWAGDEYHYLFMIATEAVGDKRRNVLIQARTLDFVGLDIRGRADEADAVDWVPFAPDGTGGKRRRKAEPPKPAPVIDEAGKPIAANCAAEGFETRGLVGSISVVDQTYHYFYTDVLPSDCGEPVAKRRMGLYLRTSRDLTLEKGWSAARLVIDALPPETLVRVAKAKGMDRWAVAYSCFRPSTAQGGPVSDICLHYTRDLAIGAISDLTLYAEPASAVRSTAYLGLRSGGDATGRYGREGFFWMTDRYGNLATPAIYPGKGGFLTWLDRLSPGAQGGEGSTLYGRPVFWSTWTVQPR